jgi:hypothetical protein
VSAAADTGLDSILAGVFRRQQEMADAINDLQFRADYSYAELNPSGDTAKTVETTRRVYMKGFNRQRHEFQTMRVNGRELTAGEMQRELIPWRVQEAMMKRTRMPFATEEQQRYRYRLEGEETLGGVPVWHVGFEPRRRTLGSLQGSALISCADSNVLQLRFLPAVVPPGIEQMSIVLDYAETQGFQVPARFDLDAEVRVAIIATLFHKRIRIQEQYADYQFNSGLGDDFFH